MKVKALYTDYWSVRNIDGTVNEGAGTIEHHKNQIYEVVSKTEIGNGTDGYTIKIGSQYGAIRVKDCEIVEGSEDDLNNNLINNNLTLVL